MAGETRELNIRITVDGKEGLATLQVTDEQLKELTKTVTTLGTQGRKSWKEFVGERMGPYMKQYGGHAEAIRKISEEWKVYKASGVDAITAVSNTAQNSAAYTKLTQELSQYNAVTDESVQSVANWISTEGLSVSTIQNVISQLEREAKGLSVSSAEYQKNRVAIENLRKGMQSAILASQQFANKTALTTRQLIAQNQHFIRGKFGVNQLGFALGDASVFAVDFRMGLLGIGNNIPFIVQGMMELKESAKDTGKAFGTVFRQAIMGPAGIILAVNLFLTAMNILLPMLSKTKEETKKLTDETKKYKNELKKLTRAELDEAIVRKEIELSSLKPKIQPSDIAKSVIASQLSGELVLPADKKYEEAVALTLKQLGALKEVRNTLGDVTNLENRRRELQEKINNLSNIDPKQGVISPRKLQLLQKYKKELIDIEERIKTLKSSEDDKNAIQERKDLVFDKQKSLSLELAAALKTGMAKELEELKQWYDERYKIAKGNAQLLTNLEAVRLMKEKEIRKKYAEASIDAELQSYDAKVRYSELKGALDIKLVQDEIAYIEKVLSTEEITIEKRIKLLEKLNKLKKIGTDSGESTKEGLAKQNDGLSTQEVLVNTLTQSWRQAGNAISSAMGRGIGLFGQANSLLQIFTQRLIAAIMQALALKAVLTILKFIPGIGPAVSEGAGMVASGVQAATGGIFTRPTFAVIGEGREPEGVFPLSKLQQFVSQPAANSNANINLHITQEPVELVGDGMKLRATLRRVERFINTKR